MRKKIIAILLCAALLSGVAACTASLGNEADESQKLLVLRSDFEFTQQEMASRIKAEYLIQNDGYKDEDAIVAIVKLPGKSLADVYLESDGYESLAEYASSAAGRAQAAVIAKNQNGLIKELTEGGLITGVKYRYDALTNAVAVETTYGNFKKIGKSERISATIAENSSNLDAARRKNRKRMMNIHDLRIQFRQYFFVKIISQITFFFFTTVGNR